MDALSLLVGGLVCLINFVSLSLFVIVFLIGRSSNVAQFAGRDSFNYWGLWFNTWGWTILSLLVVGAVALVVSACPPYRWRDSVCRILSLVLAAQGLYSLLPLMPDA